MRGFSKAIIAGNLTRDPELRSTPNGNSVCSFSVAVNRNYRGTDGSNKEEVSFIDCSAWGKLAEVISQYGKKGTGVLVSGRLSQRSWEDKDTKQKRSRTEIVVEDFNFVGGGNRDGGGNYSGVGYNAPATSSDASDDMSDIPDDIPDVVDLTDVPF
ncbi:single-stranded DNA-binding protein [Candidatus Saccharibacteria bacterium]|nr:single-stranded DNA-binding protein [Candidatus Saccharibacteria bacterium]